MKMGGGMRGDSLDTGRIKVGKPRGKHPDRRLNAVRIRNASRPGRYADGNGLYLLVDDSGAKRWLLRTVVAGKRRDIGLGSASLVSLADAREEAVRLRRIARSGGDPLAERRREQRVVPTFREAAKKVHEAHAATFRNRKHAAQWLASLEADVFPVFGDRPVSTIDSADVLRALTPIWNSKPETARRIKQRIRVILDWAKASSHRSGDNPVDGLARVLPRHKGPAKHHAALPYAKVPAFLQQLRESDAGEPTKLALEFLVLTVARTAEVLGARWTEIDREARVWTVPATRTKAGREHRVPLSRRSLEIVDQAKALSDGGPYVFPGRNASTTMSNMVFLMLLRRLSLRDITGHGFRSTFRDWAEERTSASWAAKEASLAHVVKDKTEAAYLRTDLFDQRRDLLERWSRAARGLAADITEIRATA
jgi:integrase